MATSCKDAIAKWQSEHLDQPVTEAKIVKLICQLPPMKKMDNKLNDLVACEQLSLSTNAIEKIQPLAALKSLKILSLGRNNIKRIEKLDDVAGTLEQLWLSYNSIEKLDGVQSMKKLKVLYMSNNKIKKFDELYKLKDLPEFEELLLVGNPCYDELGKDDRRREVIRRLPKLKKLDGVAIVAAEREAALSGTSTEMKEEKE
jgi:dynein light chain 1